jgi:predicted ATP-binding protein involved in virulence
MKKIENNVQNTLNPFIFFSGADLFILKQIPDSDRRTYFWIGLYNLLLGFIFLIFLLFTGWVYYAKINTSTIIYSVILGLTGISYQTIVSRTLINTWDSKNRFLFMIWGFIICILPSLLISLQSFYNYPMRHVYIYGDYKFFARIYPFMVIFYPFSTLVFYTLSYITMKQNKNDFYKTLKEKERGVINEIREKQRMQVLNKFQNNSELEITSKYFKTYKDIDSETKEIFRNLTSSRDSKSLEAYADYLVKLKDYDKALTYYNQVIEYDQNNSDVWKKMIEILRLTDKFEEEQLARARYSELVKAEQFTKNLSHQIAIKCVELNDISIYGTFNWHFRKNINILLGKNGYGKSHLMGIILSILQEEEKIARDFTQLDNSNSSSPYIKIKLSSDYPIKKDEIEVLKNKLEEKIKFRSDFIIKWRNTLRSNLSESQVDALLPPHSEIDDEISNLISQVELLEGMSYFNRVGVKSSYGKIPILAIPDSRFINKSVVFTLPVIDDRAKKLLDNGAYHFINDVPYESAIQNFLNTICVIYYDEPDQQKKFNDPIFQLINRVFKSLTGQEFIWKEIKRTQDNSGFIITVRTEGTSMDLPIQKVSQGTLSIISMIGLIFHYLSLRYPKSERNTLAEKQAIIFIDEIDAHLHPSWQQKIIRILRNEFPNIQFIITAHSPLVVAGCKEEEVSVLRKKENAFTIETIDTNLIGKPIADIFRMVFEIEEKDEMYLELSALLPFKKSIEKEAESLRKLTKRTAQEQKKLDELTIQIEKFIYMDQFSNMMTGYEEKENLKLQNEELKLEVEKLLAQNKKNDRTKGLK